MTGREDDEYIDIGVRISIYFLLHDDRNPLQSALAGL